MVTAEDRDEVKRYLESKSIKEGIIGFGYNKDEVIVYLKENVELPLQHNEIPIKKLIVRKNIRRR